MEQGGGSAGGAEELLTYGRSASAAGTVLPHPARVHVAAAGDSRRSSSSSPPQSGTRFKAAQASSRFRRRTVELDLAISDAGAEPSGAGEDAQRRRRWSHSDDGRPLTFVPAGDVTGGADASNAQLLEDLKRDSHRLAQSVTDLFASLRESLVRSTACTREHLELYRDTSASVAAETREAVDTATAFVNACMQLSAEVETLEHVAAQTRQVRANLDALELLANKVLPATPKGSSSSSGGLFGRAGT